MTDNHQEYYKMSEVEDELWWYRILHLLVFNNIKDSDKNISILDAGCGTGGLLDFLYKKGFKNLSGFDISKEAIALSKKKFQDKENVKLYLDDLGTQENLADLFDVIVSNDTFYFFSLEENKNILNKFYKHLNPDGLVLLNLPVFTQFRGIHDKTVGIKQRFHPNDLDIIINKDCFEIIDVKFWPFLLSPLIYFVRLKQRFQLRRIKEKQENMDFESDVKLPISLINNILYYITRLEMLLPFNIPFSSSMFVVLKAKK